MVDETALVMQLQCDPPVAIPSLVFMKDGCDLFFDRTIFIFVLSVLHIIVVSAARNTGDLNEQPYCVFMPQFPYHL